MWALKEEELYNVKAAEFERHKLCATYSCGSLAAMQVTCPVLNRSTLIAEKEHRNTGEKAFRLVQFSPGRQAMSLCEDSLLCGQL